MTQDERNLLNHIDTIIKAKSVNISEISALGKDLFNGKYDDYDLNEIYKKLKDNKDYRFENILGSSFLLVTQFSGIYEAVSDLVLSLGYVGAIRALSNSEMRLLIEKLHNDFGIIFINRDSQNLREQFCAYYGLS